MKIILKTFIVFLICFIDICAIRAQTCATSKHNAYTGFNGAPDAGTASTMWLMIHIILSGELSSNGDFVFFNSGTVTLNGISSSFTSAYIADGKIIADNIISSPVTHYDAPRG